MINNDICIFLLIYYPHFHKYYLKEKLAYEIGMQVAQSLHLSDNLFADYRMDGYIYLHDSRNSPLLCILSVHSDCHPLPCPNNS